MTDAARNGLPAQSAQPRDGAGPRPNGTTLQSNGYASHVNGSTSNTLAEITCGPLLNYRWMNGSRTSPVWHGSVLLVAKPGPTAQPRLQYRESPAGVVAQADHATTNGTTNGATNGITHGATNGTDHDSGIGASATTERSFEWRQAEGLKLFADPRKTFWRFDLKVPLGARETRWEYTVHDVRFASSTTPSTRSFVVPASSESMRIMFHSCNGFSVGTDEDDWSGPALWNDVLRMHAQKPCHVMIGGGDQIYNDSVRVGDGPLRKWTDIGTPNKRRHYPFDEHLRAECDEFYFNNYVKWYATEPFASANAQIAQINIWDDHDIIDGFGSYTDHFMRCSVFRGIGGVSFKYYCLFQHHIPPPPSTFTTDSEQTEKGPSRTPDPRQVEGTTIAEIKNEPCYIIGRSPGPYVEEHSRSMYCRLGAHIGFVGIDARLERTRHQVNYPETYELIFQRLEDELTNAAGAITHLIVLLGVPIAYPRLVWLENLFTSPLIAPVRLLNKRFGFAGGLFNKFDGNVDLLDDLDDHYTAKHHKRERKELIQRLQHLAAAHNARVTILGGDVHLAAAGRFYSAPRLHIPAVRDPRYMVNVISSAITNKPPPQAVANLLARRNKIHHLDRRTDETLMNLFDHDPGTIRRTADSNKCTLPSRNYALITEARALPAAAGAAGGAVLPNGDAGAAQAGGAANGEFESTTAPPNGKRKDGHHPLHAGEDGAGTKHMVASGLHSGVLPGGLDVSYRIEMDQHDREGKTEGYGFSSKLSLTALVALLFPL